MDILTIVAVLVSTTTDLVSYELSQHKKIKQLGIFIKSVLDNADKYIILNLRRNNERITTTHSTHRSIVRQI